MTKLQTLQRFNFTPAPNGKGRNAGPVGSWRFIFIILMFCASALLASPNTTFTPPHTTSFRTLISFDGTDGETPQAGLVQATNGSFYGTTSLAGANNNGTVFKITSGGTVSAVHSFDGTDGSFAQAGLVQATNGNLYGTTADGGANGYGTVFKITHAGKLTSLHSFDFEDGDGPNGLVQATDGNLYGTTEVGGSDLVCSKGCGTVFKITPAGTLTTLYKFCSQNTCDDGAGPTAGLIQAADGNLYGTTSTGGVSGYGTIFKITPKGKLTTLYNFCSQAKCADGSGPASGLIQASDGNFYGTTYSGGALNFGTVFKITDEGTLTTLHSFQGFDGNGPNGLVQANDGNFYGTTPFGAAKNYGTIFQITPAGTLTTLHSFNGTDGGTPLAGLVQATNGNFYGTTSVGGTLNNGTVFRLSVGLDPFVETLPNAGKVGATVIILGNELTGATSVSFNGTAATFTVVSGSEIRATVPTGATSGPLEVVTPSHTLSSNVAFQVGQ
jgi:uncharacterized repeat protein (TIGR03803 family)